MQPWLPGSQDPWIPGSQDPRILAGGLQTGDGGAEAQDGSPAIGQVGPTTSRVGGWISLKEVPQTGLYKDKYHRKRYCQKIW